MITRAVCSYEIMSETVTEPEVAKTAVMETLQQMAEVGILKGYRVHETYTGPWGLFLVTFDVDVEQDTGLTLHEAKAKVQDILDAGFGDSVDLSWLAAVS